MEIILQKINSLIAVIALHTFPSTFFALFFFLVYLFIFILRYVLLHPDGTFHDCFLMSALFQIYTRDISKISLVFILLHMHDIAMSPQNLFAISSTSSHRNLNIYFFLRVTSWMCSINRFSRHFVVKPIYDGCYSPVITVTTATIVVIVII